MKKKGNPKVNPVRTLTTQKTIGIHKKKKFNRKKTHTCGMSFVSLSQGIIMIRFSPRTYHKVLKGH